MAIKRLTIDGYGQIELNNVAFRRDGRIEAQCKPNATDFSTAKLENGMLLAVDGANREVKFATDGSLPVALNYSAEHIYDERTAFAMIPLLIQVGQVSLFSFPLLLAAAQTQFMVLRVLAVLSSLLAQSLQRVLFSA